MVNQSTGETKYRWYILALSAMSNALIVAAPSMCMPVLFGEISADLHLSLVQVGFIWGISSLPAVFSVLLGGAIGDRIGPRRVLIASCLLLGITGALRGIATDFVSLAITMFLFGAFVPFITMNNFKNCGLWFPGWQLGLASGILSMGMALGFLMGSMFSATVLSPWLGGWRNVLFLYGGIAIILTVPWVFTRDIYATARTADQLSIGKAIAHVARLRNVWWFGLAILGISGCVQGTLGYLPLFLRGAGWPEASADGALAAFHSISMFFVVPIALWSDRLGSRKTILIISGLMITIGVGLLSSVGGILVWVAVCIAGMVRDGFMAVFMTGIVETDGVGVAYAGTATGFVMVFSGLGNLFAPPLGNSMASYLPGLPFILWAALALIGVFGLSMAKERLEPRGQPG